MNYDISIEGEKIGVNLSKEELNQWLLEVVEEITDEEQSVFKDDFGCNNEEDFREFLYENNHEMPLILRFGKEYMVLEKSNL